LSVEINEINAVTYRIRYSFEQEQPVRLRQKRMRCWANFYIVVWNRWWFIS